MNTLTIILLIVVIIVALPFLIALFVTKAYSVQRSIVIHQPASEVYAYIKYIKNQDYYNKWTMVDPNLRRTFTGTDGIIGFIYAWDSLDKSAGKGEQEITSLEENKSVSVTLRFEKPFKNTGYAIQRLEAMGNDTRITWNMSGNNKYPLNIINLFIDKMLGPDLDTSLTNLKRILETKP